MTVAQGARSAGAPRERATTVSRSCSDRRVPARGRWPCTGDLGLVTPTRAACAGGRRRSADAPALLEQARPRSRDSASTTQQLAPAVRPAPGGAAACQQHAQPEFERGGRRHPAPSSIADTGVAIVVMAPWRELWRAGRRRGRKGPIAPAYGHQAILPLSRPPMARLLNFTASAPFSQHTVCSSATEFAQALAAEMAGEDRREGMIRDQRHVNLRVQHRIRAGLHDARVSSTGRASRGCWRTFSTPGPGASKSLSSAEAA